MLTLLPLLLAVSSPVRRGPRSVAVAWRQAAQKPEGPMTQATTSSSGATSKAPARSTRRLHPSRRRLPSISKRRAARRACRALRTSDKAPEAVTPPRTPQVDPKTRKPIAFLGRCSPRWPISTSPFVLERRVGAKRATTALEIARGDGTGDLTIDLALAKLYLDQDRPADAIPLLRRIVDEQPQARGRVVLLAGALETAGQAGAAEETLKNLLQDQPEFFRGRVQLAELYDRERRWQQAAEAWAAVQKGNPGNPEVSARLASSLLNDGRPGQASDVLRGALKGQPGDLRLSFMLAQAQRDGGDLDGAEATARDLHAAHPEDSRTTYLLAQMLGARQESGSRGSAEAGSCGCGPPAKDRTGDASRCRRAGVASSITTTMPSPSKEGVGLAADDPVRRCCSSGLCGGQADQEALAAG